MHTKHPSFQDISQSRLKELLAYDEVSGVFTWKLFKGSGALAGNVAGGFTTEGYRQIKLDQRSYKAHRLAWLYVHGAFPSGEIDHANRVRDDNRISNLRDVSTAENQRNAKMRANNTSGVTGVRWLKTKRKWRAHIGYRNKGIYLGDFHYLKDAVAARKDAENRLGFSKTHGVMLEADHD